MEPRTARPLAAILVVLLLSAGRLCCTGGDVDARNGDAVVTTVNDGDTLAVSLGGHETTIRLIGVDTPETKHPTKPVE